MRMPGAVKRSKAPVASVSRQTAALRWSQAKRWPSASKARPRVKPPVEATRAAVPPARSIRTMSPSALPHQIAPSGPTATPSG